MKKHYSHITIILYRPKAKWCFLAGRVTDHRPGGKKTACRRVHRLSPHSPLGWLHSVCDNFGSNICYFKFRIVLPVLDYVYLCLSSYSLLPFEVVSPPCRRLQARLSNVLYCMYSLSPSSHWPVCLLLAIYVEIVLAISMQVCTLWVLFSINIALDYLLRDSQLQFVEFIVHTWLLIEVHELTF